MSVQVSLLDFGNFSPNQQLPLFEAFPKPKKNYLETEKNDLYQVAFGFFSNISDEQNESGRPSVCLKDILQSLCILSYNGMSYRRTKPELEIAKEKGFIKHVPKRSTLSKYMCDPKIKAKIERLIEVSALFFSGTEHTLIIDSTWLSTRMYSGGYKNKLQSQLKDTSRKLHVACLKDSLIITCARTSYNKRHDSTFFKELVSTTIKNGFKITTLLADAGYTGKENFRICEDLGIEQAFIDFKSNAILKRGKSAIWKKYLTIFREQPEFWHEHYRYRVLIESLNSSIKRKNTSYLRCRKAVSQDIEFLLKALNHNFEVIGKMESA